MAVFTLASVRYVMPDNLNAPAGVHASGSGLPPLEVIVTPEVGAGSEIRVTLPMTTVAAGGELGQPVFSVVDVFGNAIPFYPVIFTATS